MIRYIAMALCAAAMLFGCPSFMPDPNAASGTAGRALTCEATARDTYKACSADAGDGGDVACQQAAISAYKACKADAGL